VGFWKSAAQPAEGNQQHRANQRIQVKIPFSPDANIENGTWH